MCRRSHACGAALHELLFRSETSACLLELWAHGTPRELALVVSQTTNCCALSDTRKKGVPPRQETEHLAIAEAKHTVGDLFRSHRGRGAPEKSAALLDAEIEKMGEPDFPDDDDVMSVWEEPDEMAEVLVGCDGAIGFRQRTNGAERRAQTQLQRLMAIRLICGCGSRVLHEHNGCRVCQHETKSPKSNLNHHLHRHNPHAVGVTTFVIAALMVPRPFPAETLHVLVKFDWI